ncbi:MAG: NADH-quinone oxidoreductase subunit NuoN [Actinomycetota bacterium]|nr:NADH-quinone oxidoreductase subunit NuoN [Actinomycetota bacterium]
MTLAMMSAPLAQATPLPVDIPDIPWAAISPELVLFGVGILALLLDTAGPQRLQASLLVFAAVTPGAVLAGLETGEVVLPALVALGAVVQLALTAIWRERPRMLAALLTGLGFAAAFGVTAWQWAEYAGTAARVVGDTRTALVGTASVLGDMVAVDGVALFTRFTVCLAGLVTVPLGYGYADDRRMHRGEYYPLLLFAATGMTLLAASADLIMVFIAYEVLSLSLYILSAFARRDLNSQEAALKYFLLGAFSSALLLYGIALVYGVTGSTNIAAAGQAFQALDAPAGLVVAAMALLFVGFAFKTSLVPFHMWTPDVYQGAPTPVTGFMAAATKAAAFAAFVRIFVGAFAPLQWSWTPVVWLVAVLTMLAGAVLAVVQRDLKRMLAYSAVAHAGYVVIGLVAVTREGVSALLLYLFVYAFMSLGSFGVLALFERRGRKAMALDDLRGIGRRYPVPAGMLALFLLSLAGIPGTAGFVAKFAVFRAGIDAGQTALVVVAVVSSVIAAFFYIRVIIAMFMEDEPADATTQPPLVPGPGVTAGLVVSAAAVIVLGVLPGVLVDLAGQAASFAG